MERVVVVGPGAIGMLLAARFAKAGTPVRLLDYRHERAEKLAAKGITYIDSHGERHSVRIPCSVEGTAAEPATHAFLAVKAYDTESGLTRALEVLRPDGIVVSLQNGIRHVKLVRKYLPVDRTVFGTTGHGATRVETGMVRHCGEGESLLAAEGENAAAATTVGELLTRAGFAASVVDDLGFILWRKLLFNVAINPVTALLGIRNGGVPRIPGAWEVAASCFREARGIAGAIVGPEIGQVTEEDLHDLCERTADNRSSMLQDVRNGKRTEIHALNGVVVEEARRHGRDAPVNRVVVQLVTALEEARR
jgi:2-dehydropantoate 2-reductase